MKAYTRRCTLVEQGDALPGKISEGYLWGIIGTLLLIGNFAGWAQESTPTTPAPSQVTEQLTLWMMMQQGGTILWVILALGFVALVLTFYLFFTITPKREIPPVLLRRLQNTLRAGDIESAQRLVEDRDELLANVVRAGFRVLGHERYVIQEAMQNEAERSAGLLWQRVNYLNNIATLAPLLGLLGTVWGMMLAFGNIAFETAQVRTITMAYNVSKAMITTAAGLVVAIPVMALYFYFRARLLKLLAEMEAHVTEFVELLLRSKQS
jgi:biopolymer transport protein ExbB